MTPLLLFLGYPYYNTLTTLLFLQAIVGISSGLFNELQGNIDWSKKSNLKPTILMTGLGMISALISGLIVLNIDLLIIELIISIIVIFSVLLFFIKLSDKRKPSIKRLTFFSMIGSFTKVISGVYGPIITSGQILSGYKVKKTVARTALTEGLVSLVGFLV